MTTSKCRCCNDADLHIAIAENAFAAGFAAAIKKMVTTPSGEYGDMCYAASWDEYDPPEELKG